MLITIIYFVASSLKQTPAENNNPPNLGGNSGQNQALSAEKQQQLKQFVKNFVSLYNTYSYNDYTNLTALGDYQTAELQTQTQELVNELSQNTSVGFNRQTTVDETTFSYNYDGAHASVTIEANVSEWFDEGLSPRQGSGSSYRIIVSLKLDAAGDGWLASEININKK